VRILALFIFILFISCAGPDIIPPPTLNDIIFAASKRYRVEPQLIKAVIWGESRFVTNAVRYEKHLRYCEGRSCKFYRSWIPRKYKTNKDAFSSMGLMQPLYGTALNHRYRGSPKGLFNVYTNIDIGTRYLKQKLRKYKTKERAISAYNHGTPWYDKKGRFKNGNYVSNVMKKYKLYEIDFKIYYAVRNMKKSIYVKR